MSDNFKLLFRSRENCYGQFTPLGPGKDDKDAKTHKGEVPDQAWQRHFDGQAPGLGLSPIRIDNTCFWGAVDWDDSSVSHIELEAQIKARQIPMVVCRSRSGGAHLYLFLAEPLPARRVVDILAKFVKALGLVNPDGRPIEIFPKQTALTEQMPGSWINLPYFGDLESYEPERPWLRGTRYAIIQGEVATRDQFVDYAMSMRRTAAQLAAWRDNMAGPFDDGPPCLQTIHKDRWASGMRNNGLLNVAIFFRARFPEEWQSYLRSYNQDHVEPPLPDSEIEGLIKSVENHDSYVYTCEQLPIKAHCQKAACKKQLYGISFFGRQKNLQDFPECSQLVMVGKEDPTWLLNVAGTTIELSTDDIMQLHRFKKACFEKLQIILPAIKPGDWDEKLKELLATFSKIEMPDDASTEGQFRVHVSDFLSYRTRANTKDDLLIGKPYEEGGKIYFQAKDLITFLKRRNFRALEEHEVFKALRRMGAGHHQFNIKGACVKVWFLITPQDEQTQPLTNPVEQGQPVF